MMNNLHRFRCATGRQAVGRFVTCRARPSSSAGPSKVARSISSGQTDVDERGWWEKPEEKTMQAYATKAMEPWQAERLERAYAAHGRRKMKVQDLATEIGLDRVAVISWAKDFSLKPALEREALLARRRVEMEQERIKMEQRRVAEAATSRQPHPEDHKPGFIPFYSRKEKGLLDGRKRLPADALRTLESIYDRTPFPSNDIIRGIWELHRLSRETVLEWLTQRRAADGIQSSTQKRHEKRRGGSSALFIEDGDGDMAAPGGRRLGSSSRAGGEAAAEESLLSSLVVDGAAAQAATRQAPQVVGLSSAEMAALRSSLPSRRKYKGRQLAEKMGIVTEDNAGDLGSLQIGDIKYVNQGKAASAQQQDARWAKAWRRKRSVAPATTLRKGGGL